MENQELINPNRSVKKLEVIKAEEILHLLLDENNNTTLENRISLLIDKIIIPTQDEPDVKFWTDVKKEVFVLIKNSK